MKKIVSKHVLTDSFPFIAAVVRLMFMSWDIGRPDWALLLEVGVYVVFMICYVFYMIRRSSELSAYWNRLWKNESTAV